MSLVLPGVSARRLFWGIMALGICLRIVTALGPTHDYYPDEVYQVLEQGYRLAFGRGFVPWEFEVGSRNWVLPGLVGGILAVLNETGLGGYKIYSAVLTGIAIVLSMSMVASAKRLATELAGDNAGLIAALGIAVSFPCVAASVKLTPEVLSAYSLLAAFAFALSACRLDISIAGLLAGLSFGLRMNYAPALAIIPICMIIRGRCLPDVFVFGLMALLAVTTFGIVDYFTWGVPFFSYYQS